MAKLGDLVPPELQAGRIGHAESVNVEDSTPDTELADFFHHGHALESHRFEVCREVGRSPHIAPVQLESRVAHGRG